MLKITRIFLISLLGLLHNVRCINFYDLVEESISNVSRKLGTCGKYFEYQRIDEFVNGKLVLPNINMGDTVKMTFYRIDFTFPSRFDGILLPNASSQTVVDRVQNAQMITYRVDFPITRAVPELIKIFINGDELCTTEHKHSLERYKILVLKHTMDFVNGFLPVFTYNIYIPHFVENPSLKVLPLDLLSVESPSCGLVDKEIGLSPLIYGGTEIVPGEYPWLAAIYKKQEAGNNFLCGGSLVTARIILTAAHCFQGSFSNADKIFAILGRHNLSNYLVDSYAKNEIEALILHPEYKYGVGFSDADLAILKMKHSVSFTKFIKPICLWFGSADDALFVNHTGVVAGWGSDKVAKKLKMNIVSEAECLRSSVAFKAITSKRTLCAGNLDGTGPCEGDSGGGLMINRYGRWMLRGVISAALIEQKRCNLHQYTVYCDLAKHTNWLNNYIVTPKPIPATLKEICGISGTYTRSEYPWLAAIYHKVPTGLIFFYTGVLISSRTVLIHATSYFTRKSPDYFRIYVGRYDLNNIHENEVVTRDVVSFILHPDYNKTSLSDFQENGIALIQMKSPVDFSEYVKPICLWSEPNDEPSYNEAQSGILSGWDFTNVYYDSFTTPQSVMVNMSSIQQCKAHGESNASGFLCVPRYGNSTRTIMMVKRNERMLLRGINTPEWHYYTYKQKEFIVYNDIGKYLTWIQKNMLS